MVESVLRHGNPQRAYEFIVLSLDVTEQDLKPLKEEVESSSVRFKFLNLSSYSERINSLPTCEGFSKETFFRLVIPELLPSYDKVVYLDCDLVVMDDISTLYDVELGSKYAAACRDVGMAGFVGGYQPSEGDRLRNQLGMKNPYDYFNAGVMVWNLSQFRKEISVEDIFSFVIGNELRYNDQDVLNHFCDNKVVFLDMRWNTLFDSENIRVRDIAPFAPKELQEEYKRALANPAIFHYAGPEKPWKKDVDGSYYFWREARSSALYEKALLSYIYEQIHGPNGSQGDLKVRIDKIEYSELQVLKDRMSEFEKQNEWLLEEAKALRPVARLVRKLKRILRH